MMRRFLLVIGLLGGTLGGALGPAGCAAPGGRPASPLEQAAAGRPVSFTLPRLGGGEITLAAYRGQPVLLTLFTTWCLRCQVEAPWFVRLQERHADQGLAVLGVALDKLKVDLIQTYVDFVGFRFPVLLAHPDELELVGALGQTSEVPRTVLLDARGRVAFDQQGPVQLEVLRRKVQELLP